MNYFDFVCDMTCAERNAYDKKRWPILSALPIRCSVEVADALDIALQKEKLKTSDFDADRQKYKRRVEASRHGPKPNPVADPEPYIISKGWVPKCLPI